jgi:hypothetical protein
VKRAALIALVLVCWLAQTAWPYVTTAKWSGTSRDFYVNPTNQDGLSSGAVVTAMQNAAGYWNDQTTADFTLNYAGTTASTVAQNDGTSIVLFRNASNGYVVGSTYCFWNSTTFIFADCDVVLWDAYATFGTLATGCAGTNGAYLEDLLAHEFGHFLGLNHTSVSSAVMYSGLSYCDRTNEVLDPDDIAGLEFLYPPLVAPPTENTTAPGTPINPTPLSGATEVATNTDLSWSVTPFASSYDLYFGTTSPPPLYAINLTTPTQDVGSLLGTTTYYWIVIAKNAVGATTGSTWSFTTQSTAKPVRSGRKPRR